MFGQYYAMLQCSDWKTVRTQKVRLQRTSDYERTARSCVKIVFIVVDDVVIVVAKTININVAVLLAS